MVEYADFDSASQNPYNTLLFLDGETDVRMEKIKANVEENEARLKKVFSIYKEKFSPIDFNK